MVSLVTITFNNFEELIVTLDSTKNCMNVENVIVNGGSCQETKIFLDSIHCRSLSESDHGISDAFNKGVSLATADKVAFLNSGDVCVDPNYYKWADDFLNEHLEYDFVHAKIYFNDQSAGQIVLGMAGRHFASGMPYMHPTVVARKSLFERVGGFSERYRIAMDYEWALRVLKNGSRGYFYPHPVVQMDGCGVSSVHEEKGIAESLRAIRDNGLLSIASYCIFETRRLKFILRKILPVSFVVIVKKILSRRRA